MAKVNLPEFDVTLKAVDKALEDCNVEYSYPKVIISENKPRKYLGMSQIGDPCWRKLYYSYRYAEKRIISVAGIKAIQDGFIQESVMATRLRLLPEIELITEKEDNKQIESNLLLGHFLGHLDGEIKGILEAPKTWHVWEHKSVNEKKYNELLKIREENGEKETLKKWDIIYYDQAQIYMHTQQKTRHFLTVSTPGSRAYASIRTDYNKKYAENLNILYKPVS